MADVLPFRYADLDAIADLYRRAYRGDHRRRLQALEWIHEANPWKAAHAEYLLMWEEGKVVGYLGRMPVRLFLRGAPVDAVYAQEALTDPDLRGRGVATTLFELANATPRPMISLWHNERIVSLLGKTGWTRAGALPTFRKIYRVRTLLSTRLPSMMQGLARVLAPIDEVRARGRSAAVAPYVIEPIDRFGSEFDGLFRRVATRYLVIADRGVATLNWKYVDIPFQQYQRVAVRRDGRLRGYGVFRVEAHPSGVRKGHLVDMLADPDEPRAMHALATHMDAWFREQRVDLAAGLISSGALQDAFRRAGFRRVRPTATSWLWVRNEQHAPATEAPLLRDVANWYLTLGDSDRDMW